MRGARQRSRTSRVRAPEPVTGISAVAHDSDWPRCLRAFQQHLDGQWVALQAGRPEHVTPFPVPPGLPPLPHELATTAKALLGQAEELERALALAEQAVGRHLRLARRMTVTSPAPPSFLEQRA